VADGEGEMIDDGVRLILAVVGMVVGLAGGGFKVVISVGWTYLI
jgi:hypothetical protein